MVSAVQKFLLSSELRMAYFAPAILGIIILVTLPTCSSAQSVCSGTDGGTEYMCVDWSFGSELMSLAQYKHKVKTGEDTLFGVGSYGAPWDYNIGKCYKFYVEGNSTPFIAQVTNYGADIHHNQFDMQMGGGGFGVWNACAGPTNRTISDSAPCSTTEYQDLPVDPQFDSVTPQWGNRCGGQVSRSGCASLPQWPVGLTYKPKPEGSLNNEPNLRELCERSYDWGARVENGNKQITHGHRIACPAELIEITNLKRYDDAVYEDMPTGILTSTMDCCAPASSDSGATIGNNLIDGMDELRACKRDGYTRV